MKNCELDKSPVWMDGYVTFYVCGGVPHGLSPEEQREWSEGFTTAAEEYCQQDNEEEGNE